MTNKAPYRQKARHIGRFDAIAPDPRIQKGYGILEWSVVGGRCGGLACQEQERHIEQRLTIYANSIPRPRDTKYLLIIPIPGGGSRSASGQAVVYGIRRFDTS
jgi:hypothetical protein